MKIGSQLDAVRFPGESVAVARVLCRAAGKLRAGVQDLLAGDGYDPAAVEGMSGGKESVNTRRQHPFEKSGEEIVAHAAGIVGWTRGAYLVHADHRVARDAHIV